jgi:hypothetical protein
MIFTLIQKILQRSQQPETQTRNRFKNWFPLKQRKNSVYTIKGKRLELLKETIGVGYHNTTKQANTFCGQETKSAELQQMVEGTSTV